MIIIKIFFLIRINSVQLNFFKLCIFKELNSVIWILTWLATQYSLSIRLSLSLFLSYMLIKSMVWFLSWLALCKSASTSVSITLSMSKLLHNDSSHIAFSRSKAYYNKTDTLQLNLNLPITLNILCKLKALKFYDNKESAIYMTKIFGGSLRTSF